MDKILWGLTFFFTGVLVMELVIHYGVDGLRKEGFTVCEEYIQRFRQHCFSARIKYDDGQIEEKSFEFSRWEILEGKVSYSKPKL